ncbi:Auxilin-related protein 1 [Sesamum angolense]|uniref:Auxilin-related protein 1 n=1 Tax=Sesamum angolense TaxID=2727404 RepID=A0AAE1W659_9LAMI|nr:Auxilin-related protein 1 [Sesamum angolense]
MDEFGVLVESIGFRAHGKSAPMAKSKPKPKSHFTAHSTVSTSSFDDSYSLPVDELDGIFRSNVNISKTQQSQNSFGDDDIFGGPVPSSNQYGGVDLESVFSSSINRKNSSSHLNSGNSGGFDAFDDLLGSKSKQKDPVDDLFGNFGVSSSGKHEKNGAGLDDFIPDASWPFAGPSDQNTGKGSVQSSIDDFDDFIMGGTRSGSKVGVRTEAKKPSPGTAGFENNDYIDAIFGGSNGVRPNNAARPNSMSQDSLFDGVFHEERGPDMKKSSSQSAFSTRKSSSATNVGNDFSSLFGDVATSSGEFHEIEGEPEERRRARLNRHMRMNARMVRYASTRFYIGFLREDKSREYLFTCFALDVSYDLDDDFIQWILRLDMFSFSSVKQLLKRISVIIRVSLSRKRNVGLPKLWTRYKAVGSRKRRQLTCLVVLIAAVLGIKIELMGLLKAVHIDDYHRMKQKSVNYGQLVISVLFQPLVLWPECGWRPVSLTDMITSESVKKVYKKANLCVHPDKVQQKGATLQQKYIAEKVFDLLKEAWNKFSAEELR